MPHKRILIDSIPVLYIEPNLSEAKQITTVFLYYGWGSQKETYHFVGDILATLGFQVIIPEIVKHGERAEEKDLVKDFWNVIIQSVDEFDILLKHSVEHLHVNPRHTVVFGSSMGGFISTGIFAQYPQIHGLVSVNGSGAWEKSETRFRELDGRPPATDKELESIRKKDPIQCIHHLPQRPILLQHGQADTVIPIEGERRFYQGLLEAYKGNEGLVKFQEIPRMNHFISLGMFEDIVIWIKENIG